MERELIGKNIRARRKHINKTQEDVATKLGTVKSQISKWENSRAIPKMSNYIELCDALNIAPENLLEGNIEQDFIENRELKERLEKISKIVLVLMIVALAISLIVRVYSYYNPTFDEVDYNREIIYQKQLDDGSWEIRQIIRREDNSVWVDVITKQKDGRIFEGKVSEVVDMYGNDIKKYQARIDEHENVFCVSVEYELPKFNIISFVIEYIPIE